MKKFKNTHNKTKRVNKTLAGKFTKAQKRTLSRRLKKGGHSKDTTPAKYTITMMDSRETLTKSQIKRALNRIAIITFVNNVCNKNFTEYNEAMVFIRSVCAGKINPASVANPNSNSEKVIQLSADKTDGSKVVTFKEKTIMKDAA